RGPERPGREHADQGAEEEEPAPEHGKRTCRILPGPAPTAVSCVGGRQRAHVSPDDASSEPSRVSWRGSPMSKPRSVRVTVIAQTWKTPLLAARTASVEPSGDQAGPRTYGRPPRCACFAPSSERTQTSLPAPVRPT